MLGRSLRGPCAPARTCGRARLAACRRPEAVSGGRRGNRQVIGDKQVLHYRMSSPRFGHADAESQPAAAAVQPVIAPETQQLDHGVLPRDLEYEIQQSQERLQMAKALRLGPGGLTHTISPPDINSTDSADLDLEDLTDFNTIADSAAVLRTEQQQQQQQQAEDPASSAAGISPTTTTINSSSSSIIGWGNVADALGLSITGSTSAPAAAADAQVYHFTQATAAAAHTVNPVPATTSTATAEETPATNIGTATSALPESTTVEQAQVRQARREIPQEQLHIVQMGIAQALDGGAPHFFYMPDPLAVPCVLEEAISDNMLMSYDGELVDCMWEEAIRRAGLERAVEGDPAEAADAATDSTISAESATATAEPSTEAAGAAAGAPDSVAVDPEMSSAATAIAEEPAAAVTTVEFKFHCQTQPGQRLLLTGDQPCLGSWDLQQAVKLVWSEGHVWRASLDIPAGARVAYKAVLQLVNKQYKWQSGADYVLEANGSNQPPQHAFK